MVFDAAVVDVDVAVVAVAAFDVDDAVAVAAVFAAAGVTAAAVAAAAVAVAADTTGFCFECLPAKPEPENYLQENVRYRYGTNSAHSACSFLIPGTVRTNNVTSVRKYYPLFT